MLFDPNNNIVKLCAEGMNCEGGGRAEDAGRLFQQAWNESVNDFEKFIAAHYVARHQKTIEEKLKWDITALDLALKIKEPDLTESFPSLYLNVAKCYEDMEQPGDARKNYELALSFTNALPDDGYSKMIKSGIAKGIERVSG